MSFQKPSRVEDPELLRRIKSLPCLICSGPSDPCHVRSRGAGGPDKEWNVIPLCRAHHREQHAQGWRRFMNDYPLVKDHLTDLGWIVGDAHEVWVMSHPEAIKLTKISQISQD